MQRLDACIGFPQNTQDKLPFNSCEEFVNWLSDLVAKVMSAASGNPHTAVLRQRNAAILLGHGLAEIAYFNYDRYIKNEYEGFKDELVDAGEGSPEGKQGAGVYGHVLFGAGETLAGKVDPVGLVAFHANRFKDWAQAARGSSQYASERAGNIAGQKVGNLIWEYMGHKRSQSELTSSLKGVLCIQ